MLQLQKESGTKILLFIQACTLVVFAKLAKQRGKGLGVLFGMIQIL